MNQEVMTPVWLIGATISVLLAIMGWMYVGYREGQSKLEGRIASLESGQTTTAGRTSVLETQNTDVIRRLASIETKVDKLIEKR